MINKRLINTGVAAAAAFDPLQNFEVVTYTGNGGTQKITGYIRKGAAFNGSSSYIELSDSVSASTGNNDFSLSAWVYLNSMPSNFACVMTTQANWYFYIFITSDGKVQTYNGSVVVESSTGVITSGQWYHIAATVSSTNGKNIYVNGTNVATSANTSNSSAVSASNMIGTYDGGGINQYYLNGKIDQVRIFNKALSSGEVTTLKNETYASSTKSTTDIFGDGSGVALYELDENANDTGGVITTFDIDDIDFANKKVFNPTDIGNYTTPGCVFGDSGNRLYAGDEVGGTIGEYALSTPYDISTASSTATGTVNLDESYLINIRIISSTRIFTIEDNSVIEYQMSTPWSISTASSTSNKFTRASMGSALSNSEFRGFDFNSDGTKIIVSYSNSSTTQAAFEIFNLSTAYDISGLGSATPASSSGWINVSYDNHRGLYWSENLDQVFYIGLTGIAHQFDFSTAGDASTITLTKTRSMNYGNLGGFEYYPEQDILLTASETNTNYVQASWSEVKYNGTATNVNFLGMAFQPDLVWIKERSGAYGSYPHILMDTVRGFGVWTSASVSSQKPLSSNETSAEGNYKFNVNIQQSTNGFSLGSTSFYSNYVNDNTLSYVAWCWKAGGTAVSNTNGSITSTVSANTTAGFSIVKWSANGSVNDQLGHGLSSTPELIIYKALDTTSNWWTLTTAIDGSLDYLKLNNTDQAFDQPNTTISSTTISNYNFSSTNMIAYCFHSVDGYQKIGSYTGTGSAGNSITTGFQPRWILIKRTNGGTDWYIIDSNRGGDKVLWADLSNSEETYTATSFDANGFTLNWTHGYVNASGGTYIYLAIA